MKACEVCGTVCKPNSVRFCSPRCVAKSQEKPLDSATITTLAAAGATAKLMCQVLNVDRATLRRRLRSLGLYRTWTYRRYKNAVVV